MRVLRLDEVDRTQREVPGGVLALVPRVLRLDYTKYEDSGTVTVGQYQNSGAKTGTLDIKISARWDSPSLVSCSMLVP